MNFQQLQQSCDPIFFKNTECTKSDASSLHTKELSKNNTNNWQNAEFATRDNTRQLSVIRKSFSRYIFLSSKGGRWSDSQMTVVWAGPPLAWKLGRHSSFYPNWEPGRRCSLVCSSEKNLSVSRNDLHPIHRRITASRAYLHRSSSLFPSGVLATPLSSSRFFLESAAKNVTSRPGRASLSRFLVHRAGSPFFQILHILSTSAYAALNFGAVSETSHATLPLSRDVSLPLTAFRFLLTVLKGVHKNFSTFKEELMKNAIFFWSPYIYFNLYRSPARSKSSVMIIIFIVIVDKVKGKHCPWSNINTLFLIFRKLN